MGTFEMRLLALLALCGAGMALPAAPDASELTSDDYYSWIFAVGGGGQIIKSSDAGKTWICSQCGDERLVKTDLNAVHFFTSRLGSVQCKSAAASKAFGSVDLLGGL